MTVTKTIHEPFGSEDVRTIVNEEVKSGTDELKERVTGKVREFTGITTGNLPERVGTWIHQLCLPHTAGTQEKKFIGKLAESIDLRSIPNRRNA